MARRPLVEREAMMSRELTSKEALIHFPDAVKNLRTMLMSKAPQYGDVKFSDLIQQVDWFVDADGDLMAKSWYFSMFNDGDVSDQDQDPVMTWNGARWIETQGSLGEVHMEDPTGIPQLGGAEPAPGNDTGMDRKNGAGMTVAEVRTIVRRALKGK